MTTINKCPTCNSTTFKELSIKEDKCIFKITHQCKKCGYALGITKNEERIK